jgi:hypothetical protein
MIYDNFGKVFGVQNYYVYATDAHGGLYETQLRAIEMESVYPCEQTETVTKFRQVSKRVAVESVLIKPC